jgi:hypothetical protein
MDSHPETPQWTAARLAAVAPTWEPDPVRARMSIRDRPATRSRQVMYAAAAATAALIVAFVSPSGRALAQDLWYRFYASRIAVVRLDLSHNPLETSIRSNDKAVSVDSVEEAAHVAGFTPYLPVVDGLPERPVLNVLGRIEMQQTIRVQRLAAALAAAGASDLDVPGEWDGVRLRAEIGPIVAARYLDRSAGAPKDVEIMQMPAVRLEMPADFPLARLAEIVFRSGGSSWWEARRLGEEYANNPAWLFDVPAEAPVTVEEIPLPRGNALLVQYLDDDDDPGSTRSLVLLGRPGRLYGIVASDRELALRIAGALP